MDCWGKEAYTLEECIQWEYDLFITNSLKGNTMEHKAMDELQLWLPQDYTVSKTNRLIDEEYRIDLEISKNNETVLGIQVKPYTYRFTRGNVKSTNTKRNKKYGYDVAYMYYDETDEFINTNEIIAKI